MSSGFRIVHLASGREWRGGQRQVWLLARGLHHAQGTGDPSLTGQCVITGRDTELAHRLQHAGVPVLSAPWAAGLDPRVLPVTLRALGPNTILHAHDSHAATLASVASHMRSIPFVVTRRVAFRLRRTGVWHNANRVIAVSRAVADRLERDGIAPDRIVVIPSSVDVIALRAAAPAGIRLALGIPTTASLVVQVGALTAEKGHDLLLQAASLFARDLPDLHLLIVGEGPLRRTLEKDVARRRLSDRVHVLGHLAEPAGVLREADVAVLASREEGFGATVLEALALGVPVVGTRVGGIPEVLAHGGGVLVPPGDAMALAEAVAGLLRDRTRRSALAEEGRAAALRFAVEPMVEATLAVYRSVSQTVEGT